MKKGWLATWFLFLGVIIGFFLSPMKNGISVRVFNRSAAPDESEDEDA